MHVVVERSIGQESAGPASPRTLSTTPYLPTELWIMVFDMLYHQRAMYRRVHPKTCESRLSMARQLQNLGLVCREWRDMIRPFVWRNITFTTRDGVAAEYLRILIRSYERFQSEYRIKAMRIDSLWLGKYCSREFDDVFLSFVPLLSHTRMLYCDGFLPTDAFRRITELGGSMLTSLSLKLSQDQVYRILALVPLLNSLTILSLRVVSQCPGEQEYARESLVSRDDFISNIGRTIPQLQSLHICAPQKFIIEFLFCLRLLSMDRLHSIRLVTDSFDRLHRWVPHFFGAHGAKLAVLGLISASPRLAHQIFYNLPRLQYLEISQPDFVATCLRHMPHSVNEIVLIQDGDSYSFWANGDKVKALRLALAHLPPGSSLQAFRVRIIWPNFDRNARGYRATIAEQNASDQIMCHLEEFARCLKERGMQLLSPSGASMDASIAAWSAEKASRPPSRSLRVRGGT